MAKKQQLNTTLIFTDQKMLVRNQLLRRGNLGDTNALATRTNFGVHVAQISEPCVVDKRIAMAAKMAPVIVTGLAHINLNVPRKWPYEVHCFHPAQIGWSRSPPPRA
jgi:hypothetical protein